MVRVTYPASCLITQMKYGLRDDAADGDGDAHDLVMK
jgi:hypothetical protein